MKLKSRRTKLWRISKLNTSRIWREWKIVGDYKSFFFIGHGGHEDYKSELDKARKDLKDAKGKK